MDDCTQYLELISARLDGELSVSEEERLQAHLAQCPACRALLADLTAIHLETTQPIGEVPVGFSDQVMRRVQADVAATARKKRRRWQMGAGMAAALALVLWAVGPMGLTDGTDNAAPEMFSYSLADNERVSTGADQTANDETSSAQEDVGDQDRGVTPTAGEVDACSAKRVDDITEVPVPSSIPELQQSQEGGTAPAAPPAKVDSTSENSQAAEPAETDTYDPDTAFTLVGQVPLELAGYPSYAWEDGSLSIQVPAEEFAALADSLYALGMTGEMDAARADAVWIHVVPVTE